ncbi:sn-glycerol-3-phosphate ABC transporter ATP-binding protein UgpC [Shinella daejeonensis]|uniref:ABC transporter ATP-binding protein n=1 Tax=Shinella daejeonensis TaxID=659017 RepID=UPI0020C7C22B|nr:sn-glycerol-3-phosphate ABC transporter ATP-binding protein UgpC [Shinella daejeonensis]MCP8896495.1 sn-glycerol-3-phosphate ABC transporter ATP-binding protein UgpC [Shinella daejeonensis]
MTGIELRSLRKTYSGNDVLHGLDLTVTPGEFLVLLGPSGCGKSTLMRMIAGLEAVTTGDILIDGRRVNDIEPRARGCAMVFQNYALYPHMSVSQNIGYALKVAGVPKAERQARISAVAGSLALTDFLDRKPSQLSGGQRQRVAMGRAMIRSPRVFLYDEPLSNLDAKLRVAMRLEIRRLHQKLGTTTVFVTHDQVEAMTLADRIVVMNAGRIEQVGTPSEVYQHPQSTFVAEFIGAPGMGLVDAIADPKRGVLCLGDGQEVRFDAARWPDLPHGAVRLGLRAEEIGITAHPSAHTVMARVELIENIGPHRHAHLSLSGCNLIAQVPNDFALQSGAQVAIGFDMAALQLFDPATGRRHAGQNVPLAERIAATV